jgi:hypothetical protein
MTPTGYDLVFLLVLAFLIYTGLRLYHHRQIREAGRVEAIRDGWRTETIPLRTEVMVCPHCGSMCLPGADVDAHRFRTTSACADFVERAEEAAALEEARKIEAAAEQAGRINTGYSVSATVGGESFTNEPAGEIATGRGEIEG